MNRHILLATALRAMTASVSSSAVHGRVRKSTRWGVISLPCRSTISRIPPRSVSARPGPRTPRTGPPSRGRPPRRSQPRSRSNSRARPRHDPAHLRVDGGVAQVRAVGDAQPADVAASAPPASRSRRPGCECRSRGSGPAITDSISAASSTVRAHRADVLERLPARDARVALVAAAGVERDPAHRGLEAEERRSARRGCGPSRRRRCRARTGTSRSPPRRRTRRSTRPGSGRGFQGLRVVGKTGLWPDAAVAELRHVRLADHDRARRPSAARPPCRPRRARSRGRRPTPTRADALGGDQVLDADGHARERPDVLAGGEPLLGARASARGLRRRRREGVDLRVELLDPVQRRVHDLDR